MLELAIFGIPYLIIFPINYILCSIRAEIEIMKKYKEQNIKSKECMEIQKMKG